MDTLRAVDGTPLYHVISLKPEGYVICSADTEIEPILAFSAVGHYEANPQNPLYVLVERDARERLDQVRNHPITAATKAALRSDPEAKWNELRRAADNRVVPLGSGIASVDDLRVEPFVQSRWNQSAIWDGSSYVACYNYYTPPHEAGNPNNYPCGCNNTAWAQIMRYFHYPTQPVGTNAFSIRVDGVETTRTLRGGNGSGGPYLWDSMPLRPSASTLLQERQAIGSLCSDIGIACGTAYEDAGSSAGMRKDILKTVFFYSNAIRHSEYGEDFQVAVRPNLDARLPVALEIFEDGGAGHVVVCDGYGFNLASSYYHLNLGWGGAKDAWYNLPEADTDWYHFTRVSAYFYNIYTNGVGEIISGRVLETNGVPISNAVVYAVAGGQTNVAVTDGRGIYALSKLPSGTTFSLRCEKSGYRFPSREMATGASSDYGSTGNKWGLDFTGFIYSNQCLVLGYVAARNGAALSGIPVEFSGVGSSTTDVNGVYFKIVPLGWTGTVTPTGGAFDLIAPPWHSITNVTNEFAQFDFESRYRVHVMQSASGSHDGSSWANAFTNLQAASTLSPEGTEFWIAAGTYRPGTNRSDSFSPKPNSALYGGFAGTETHREQRSWAHQATILSGDIGLAADSSDNSYHVFTTSYGVILDGFTVTAGRAEEGVGGGIYGAYGAAGVCSVVNCVIMSNSAFLGGGAYLGTLYNCTLTGNSASYGGGTYEGTLNNCTLTGNSASNSGGGAYQGTLNNCIVYNNSGSWEVNWTFGGNLNNCCTWPLPWSGTGNITNDPGFVDYRTGDLRLSPGSPCINAGSNQAWMGGAVDLAGNPRISPTGGLVDLGAYEYPPDQPFICVTSASLVFGSVAVTTTNQLVFTVQNTGGGSLIGTVGGVSPPFSIVGGTNYVLGGGTSTNVSVRFAPTTAGTYSNNVAFNSSAWNAGNLRRPVTGTATTPPAGVVQFVTHAYNSGEHGGTLALTVARAGGSFGSVSATFATAPGTATAGADYTATNGTLSWANGDSASKSLYLTILDDGTPESTEAFMVNLTGVTGAGLGSPTSVVVTITDDDVETVSTPSTPAGPTIGLTNQLLLFTTGGSTDNAGHEVEYRFGWNGTISAWGSGTSWYSWAHAGTYSITAQARCVSGSVTSGWSSVQTVVVTNTPIPPLVVVTNPVAGSWRNEPTTIAVDANAQSQNPGGSITQVVFYANGTVLGSDTTSPYRWTWNAVMAGTYLITARAWDYQGVSTLSAQVNVFVNAKPVASNYAFGIGEDTGPTSVQLQASDPEGSNLTYSIVSAPTNGTLTGGGNRRSYQPATNYVGCDSFTWRCSDGMATSDLATVTITMSNVNDSPVAVADTGSTPPDATVLLPVLANDFDVDGDALSILSAGNPAHGIVGIGLTNLLYTPDAGYTGPDSFSYTISDGHGGTASATVSVTVAVPGLVQWSTNAVQIHENAGEVALVATRTGGSAAAASVQYGVSNGSALAGSDYVMTNGTISWAAGDSGAKTVVVAVVNDTLPEENETFTVNLFNDVGVGLGTWVQQTVTILANDFQYFSDSQSALGYANKDWSFMTAWNLASGAFLVGPDWYNGTSTFTYTLTYQQWIALFLYDDGTAQTRELRWSYRQPHVQ